MTQAQLDLQSQLEQTNNTDLTTQPLFTDSLVFFSKSWNKLHRL